MMSPYSLTHEVTGLEIIQCVLLMQKTITACFMEIGRNRVSDKIMATKVEKQGFNILGLILSLLKVKLKF